MLLSALDSKRGMYSFDDIISWFTQLKLQYDLTVKTIPLSSLRDWVITDNEIRHVNNKYFKVIAANVEISSREVSRWCQPLIQSAQEGLIAFVVKKINGVFHFLVQAKLECGNFDVLEFAPTVQCLTGNYRETVTGGLPFLEYVLSAKKQHIRYDSLQSEEGGRFYREQNRNVIIEAAEDFPVEVPENYIWMTLNQLFYFIKFNNYLNIQSRSLLSAVEFI
jgi:oxidase EvaA